MVQCDPKDTKGDIPPMPTPPKPYDAPQMPSYPAKDAQNPPGETNSKGSGFWSGFCSGLCCYCCLDICF